MKIAEYFTPENEAPGKEEHLSPSGRYKVVIRQYGTKPGCWNFSRGTVYRVSDGQQVCDIQRNYSHFSVNFISKNGQEWLITGRSYMNQTIINLDTGQEFEPPCEEHGAEFCWVDAWLSPDEKTLVVEGCIWGAPYEYRFFDFTDPSKGWSEIEPVEGYIRMDEKKPSFHPDGTITTYQSGRMYTPLGKEESSLTETDLEKEGSSIDKEENWILVDQASITYRIEDHKLIKVSEWISSEEQEKRHRRQEASEAFNKMLAEFKARDPLYLRYKDLVSDSRLQAEKYESYGVTHSSWCSFFKEEETRWCRRINNSKSQGYTLDLEWAIKTGPIKLVIFHNGKSLEDKFFEHSVKGMEEAFAVAIKLIGDK